MSNFDDDTQSWDGPLWEAEQVPGYVPPAADPTPTGATRRLNRTGRQGIERTRTHHVVTARPTDESYDDFAGDWSPVDQWVEPEQHAPRRRAGAVALGGAGIDPRLVRVGAVVAAGVLIVPLAMAFRDGPDETLQSGDAATTTTTVAIAQSQLPAPAATTITVPTTVAPVTTPAAVGASGSGSGSSSASPSGVAAAAVVVETTAPKPKCAGTYAVIANDFWNRFPKTSGASVQEWLTANNATAATPLYVGDELCIPAGARAPAPPPTTTAPPTTATPVTTAAPATTAAPVAAAPVTTAAPAPAPAATQPPAAIPAGARSTEAVCGAMPTSNGNPAGTPGPAQVEALIREIWPDELEVRALCIAKREARLRADLNNYCCYGVFAIYFRWVPADLKATYGLNDPTALYDARTNIAVAYQLYLRGGWTPWSQTDPGSG